MHFKATPGSLQRITHAVYNEDGTVLGLIDSSREVEVCNILSKIFAIDLVVGHSINVDERVHANFSIFDEQINNTNHVTESATPGVTEHDCRRLWSARD